MFKKLLRRLLDNGIVAEETVDVETLKVPEIKPDVVVNDTSRKFLDIVLTDLDKYPPHEWNITYSSYGSTSYSHPCLSYSLYHYQPSYDSNCHIQVQLHPYESVDRLDKNCASTLYKKFKIPFDLHTKQQEAIAKQKELADFMDNSTRILCKEDKE